MFQGFIRLKVAQEQGDLIVYLTTLVKSSPTLQLNPGKSGVSSTLVSSSVVYPSVSLFAFCIDRAILTTLNQF